MSRLSRKLLSTARLRGPVAFAFALLLTAASALAQETRSLSLDEAVALALEYHHSLHAAQMRAEAAEARFAETQALRGPAAQISGGYTRLSSVPEFSIPAPLPAEGLLTLNPSIENSYQVLLSARQPLYAGGRLSGERDAARARAWAAHEEAGAARADLVLAVRLAYWTAVRAREERKAVEEDLAQVRAHLTDVQRLLGEGMATSGDELKVETRLSAVLFRRIASDHALRNASMGLASLAGLPLDLLLDPSTPLPPPAVDPYPVSDMTATAMENRPELRSLRLRLEAARASAAVARAERRPQVSLTAHYLYGRPNNRIFPAEDRFNDTWDVGLGVTFDLWDGGAAVQRTKQAEARAREAQDALALASDAVALEVRRVLLALGEARSLIAVAETGMRQAEEDLRMTRERFKEGLVLNAEVLDSEVAFLEARLRRTQALTAHAVALAELDRAIGR